MTPMREVIAARPMKLGLLKQLWALAVVLMFAAQIGVLAHQSLHQLRGDLVAQDDCALCQVSHGMSAPPAPPVLALPVLVLIAIAVTAPAQTLHAARNVLPFRSRAPPISVRS